MKNTSWLPFIVITAFLVSGLEAQTTNSNNLTVLGSLDVTNTITFGTTATNQSAVLLNYTDSNHTVGFVSTHPSSSFTWQDNGEANNKLLLDGSNNLSLFDTNGNIGIFLNPASGGISLAGTGSGIVLADGTVLSNSNSLHQMGLYNSSGSQLVSFDANGNLVVGAPMKFSSSSGGSIDFGGGTSLNLGNVTYLNQTLRNLGYHATNAADMAFSLPANFTVAKAVGDTSGNVYLIGSFTGSGLIGGATYTCVGSLNTFVVMLNSSGQVQWVSCFGGSAWNNPNSLAVDANGNVDVLINYGGTITSGGLPSTLNASSGADVAVIQINNSGTVNWATSFGGGQDTPVGIAVDGNGNVYVTGNYWADITSGVPTTLSAANGSDVFVTQISASGALQWVNGFGGGHDTPVSIAVDGSGNAYIGGIYNGGIATGIPHAIDDTNYKDIFIVKYNVSGTALWGNGYSTQGYDAVFGLTVDAVGNTYLFDDISGIEFALLKCNSSGTQQWLKKILGYNDGSPTGGVALDGSGNAVVWGEFSGRLMASGVSIQSIGNQDGFLMAFNTNGIIQWTKDIGSVPLNDGWNQYTTGYMQPVSITVDGTGALILTGIAQNNFGIGNQIVMAGSFVYRGAEAAILNSTLNSTAGFSWGGSQASTNGAVALGVNALASAQGAVALGNGVSSGTYSFSDGFSTTAQGEYSTSLGSYNNANGYASVVLGSYSTANGYAAVALGNNDNASGNNATAIGFQTLAASYASLAMGQYNVGVVSTNGGSNSWIPTDSVLEIGNGTSGAPSNAVTIFKNGNLRTVGTVESQGGVRIPPGGDLGMGIYTSGNNPTNLIPATGLLYPSGN